MAFISNLLSSALRLRIKLIARISIIQVETAIQLLQSHCRTLDTDIRCINSIKPD
jgi:hypothetical protein